MTDLEINEIVQGVFLYLKSKTEHPLDRIAVLGTALLILFHNTTNGKTTFETFAQDFHNSMLESWTEKSDHGSERLQ